MTGEAIISELKDLSTIEGADRIMKGSIFGETVIVSKDHSEGEIGVLFDCETQLSHEFCHVNNLYRHSHLNSNKEKSGYIEDNRRIRPIRLKGVKCSGMWMPISSLSFAQKNKQIPSVGTQFTEIEGNKICEKYIRPSAINSQGNKEGKARENIVPTFKEHVDTDHFMRNTQHIKRNSVLIITEKAHGTSCRVGNLPVIKRLSIWKSLCFSLANMKYITKIKEYDHVVGSRRVIKQAGSEDLGSKKRSYYDVDVWSHSSEVFRDKLEKGETVYYEIVGFLKNGSPIMPSQGNKKLKPFMDKDEYSDFLDRYGDTTSFTYGCDPCEHKILIYRMTLTNKDGHTLDYTWDQVKMRAEQMGVDVTPELKRIIVKEDYSRDDEVDILNVVSELSESVSDNFPNHIREGVVVRIDGESMTPKFLKHKSFLFKVLEGIIKDSDSVDIEEEESIIV